MSTDPTSTSAYDIAPGLHSFNATEGSVDSQRKNKDPITEAEALLAVLIRGESLPPLTEAPEQKEKAPLYFTDRNKIRANLDILLDRAKNALGNLDSAINAAPKEHDAVVREQYQKYIINSLDLINNFIHSSDALKTIKPLATIVSRRARAFFEQWDRYDWQNAKAKEIKINVLKVLQREMQELLAAVRSYVEFKEVEYLNVFLPQALNTIASNLASGKNTALFDEAFKNINYRPALESEKDDFAVEPEYDRTKQKLSPLLEGSGYNMLRLHTDHTTDLPNLLDHDASGRAAVVTGNLGFIREDLGSENVPPQIILDAIADVHRAWGQFSFPASDGLRHRVEIAAARLHVNFDATPYIHPLPPELANAALTYIINKKPKNLKIEKPLATLYKERTKAGDASVLFPTIPGKEMRTLPDTVLNGIMQIVANASKEKVGASIVDYTIVPSEDGASIDVLVWDNGSGMTPELLKNIFVFGKSGTGSTGVGLGDLDKRLAAAGTRLSIATRKFKNEALAALEAGGEADSDDDAGFNVTGAVAELVKPSYYSNDNTEKDKIALEKFLVEKNAATVFKISIPLVESGSENQTPDRILAAA